VAPNTNDSLSVGDSPADWVSYPPETYSDRHVRAKRAASCTELRIQFTAPIGPVRTVALFRAQHISPWRSCSGIRGRFKARCCTQYLEQGSVDLAL